jgi:hypothetical protein
VWKAPLPSDVFGAQENVAYRSNGLAGIGFKSHAKHSNELCKVIIGVARPLWTRGNGDQVSMPRKKGTGDATPSAERPIVRLPKALDFTYV